MKKSGHDYYSDNPPKGYTRVTSVLLPYKNFDNVSPEVLRIASERGSLVHDFCELYALNMLIQIPPDHVKPYFESFKNWFDEFVDEVIFAEKRLSHPGLLLTGQFDLLCRMKGSNQMVLVDYKTPVNSEITWRLQMAAYSFLLRDLMRISIDRRISLRLDREGKPPKVAEYVNHDMDERLYLNQLEIYRLFHPKIS